MALSRIPHLARCGRQLRLPIPAISCLGLRLPTRQHVRAFGSSSSSTTKARKVTKAAEASDIYKKLSPIDHVLLRPGMYVGPTTPVEAPDMWIYHEKLKVMVKAKRLGIANAVAAALSGSAAADATSPAFSYVPGLLKLFDEILVNACDNKARDASMSLLDVRIQPGSAKHPCTITIKNDGKGIPVVMHASEKVYVPELVMGHLLTGSNFDDDGSTATGGRHGYGAKLTNIFSTSFTISTLDANNGKMYRQAWSHNMKERQEPTIEHGTGADFTEISFQPDLQRFGLRSSLDPGTYLMMIRRVVDAAAHLGPSVNVMLNGKRIGVGDWATYCGLFELPHPLRSPERSKQWHIFQQAGWHVGISAPAAAAPEMGKVVTSLKLPGSMLPNLEDWIDDYQHPLTVAFANGMFTNRGGNHLQAVLEVFSRKLLPLLSKQFPDVTATPAAIKTCLQCVMSASLVNPSFDSQSKEQLTSDVPASVCTALFSDKSLKEMADKTTILNDIGEFLRSKMREETARSIRRKSSSSENKIRAIPKLEDANMAGTKQAHECTLILTEGDSAKALAVAGLSVVGRDRFGVFPLRGKLLNVYDLSPKEALENQEVTALVKILGLDFNKTYAGLAPKERGLRYGRILIMTDQDVDGNHIKGLIINFFHKYWPELVKLPAEGAGGFIEAFSTPLIKARNGREVLDFYNLHDYNKWREELHASDLGSRGKWTVKYYKGLGTSTSEEGRSYFKNYEKHRLLFSWQTNEDSDKLVLAFAKDLADDRKLWLSQSTVTSQAEQEVNSTPLGIMTYKDFVDTQLIEFSRSDLTRSIPSVLDGLKPSQRKVLYACFRRDKRFGSTSSSTGNMDWLEEDAGTIAPSSLPKSSEVKVSQLAGYVAENTAYHHGEQSLIGTIINLAQDFVGSNNMPLLSPLGQFGTRLQGGKDAASARYIFTKISGHAHLLFPAADDPLYRLHEDDGVSVEPVSFVPIAPLVLFNGTQGIGTGWSTYVPPHDPLKVVDVVLSMLDGNSAVNVPPWWKGFQGSVTTKGESILTRGIINWTDPDASVRKKAKRKTDEVDDASPFSTRFLRITELPIGRWIEDYKSFLIGLVDKGTIVDFREYHTESNADFLVEMSADGMQELARAEYDLQSFFKLGTSFSLKNMHLFDAQGSIRRYRNASDVLKDFFPMRMEFYIARHFRLEMMLKYHVLKENAKLRFLKDIASGQIEISKHSKSELIRQLWELNYPAFESGLSKETECDVHYEHIKHLLEPNGLRHQKISLRSPPTNTSHLFFESNQSSSGFDYLLNIPILRLTGEYLAKLENEVAQLGEHHTALSKLQAKDLWKKDLLALRSQLG